MTVSRITGDARRVLEYMQVRFFLNLFLTYFLYMFSLPCRRAVELVQATRGPVKVPHIREVVR